MGKQNKKPVSAKKKKSSSSNKSPVVFELDAVIEKADESLDTSDLDTALQLYQYAAQQLRTQILLPNTVQDTQTSFTLIKILSKMGEIKVSMAQQESAKIDFMEALETLSKQKGTLESSSSSLRRDKIQYIETQAGIQLYLAQLSQGDDALEYFTAGIDSLIQYQSLVQEDLQNHHPNRKREDIEEEEEDFSMEPPGNDSEEGDVKKMEQSLLEARRQLCKAYCSIAELYLTDLCYELDAEVKCEEAIQKALTYDDPQASPDALQALANLRLSQSEDQRREAYRFMLQAYERMRLGCEALAQLVGLGSKEEDDDVVGEKETMDDEDEKVKHTSPSSAGAALELKDEMLQAVHSLPPFEFRCQSVKILLECANLSKQSESPTTPSSSSSSLVDTCVEASIQILGSLLAENDEVPEIFYLLGTAFLSGSCPNLESARLYLDRALEMTEKIKHEMEKDYVMGMNDEQWEDDHEDLIARIEDIQKKIAEIQQ